MPMFFRAREKGFNGWTPPRLSSQSPRPFKDWRPGGVNWPTLAILQSAPVGLLAMFQSNQIKSYSLQKFDICIYLLENRTNSNIAESGKAKYGAFLDLFSLTIGERGTFWGNSMLTRTTRTTVTFAKPFFLGDVEERFPAGTYDVDTEEELLEGLSFYAYRRVRAVLHLPTDARQPGVRRSLTTLPEYLDLALARDIGTSPAPCPAAPAAASRHQHFADSGAVDRAVNEGMPTVAATP